MKYFCLPGFEYVLSSLHLEPSKFLLSRYANQELYIELDSDVAAQDCLIVGSVSPPETNLAQLSLLVHTLKKECAARVSILLTYFAYTRQDKAEAGKSLGIRWVGDILYSCGVDEILTIDLHSRKDNEILPLPVRSVLPTQIWVDNITELNNGYTVVAPDEGAKTRAQALVDALGDGHEVCYLQKIRTDGIEHLGCRGKVTDQVVIIDDILDTGSTVISAIETLKNEGVKSFVVAVSHGLFTDTKWQQLWDMGVSKIYCLDTMPTVRNIKDPRVVVVSCEPLISKLVKLT